MQRNCEVSKLVKLKWSVYIKIKSIMGIDYAEYLHILLWSDLQDILLSEEGKMEKIFV